jgi:hypothetical protein
MTTNGQILFTQPNNTEGNARKDQALEKLRSKYPKLILLAKMEMLKALLFGGEVTITIEQVRDRLELQGVSIPKTPMAFGAVSNTLSRQGVIERVGFITKADPKAHSRPVSVWRLTDAAKARRLFDALLDDSKRA